jgi:hypothetical protein
MKTMTCRQLGGPCDLAHHGDSANDVIKAQDSHLKEAVANGDETLLRLVADQPPAVAPIVATSMTKR